MLRITYTPPDAEPRVFEMPTLEEGIDSRESELIEDNGGKQWSTFMEWTLALTSGSIRASRVLLWVMLRRENPSLDLETFHFPLTALVVDQTDDEPAESEGKDAPGDSDTSSP